MRLSKCLLAIALTASGVAWAADEDMSAPRAGTIPNVKSPPVEWLSPEAGAQAIHIHPDFNIEVVANEPDVISPVSMTFDENGRMWVVEMQDYMPNVEGKGEGDPESRIVVLEDTNQDGTYDKQVVFLDKLSLPRTVTRVVGGVIVAEGKKLWFCEDTDGDLVCDNRKELISYATSDNIEHTENSLTWNIDNWYYNAKSKRRMRFVNGEVIVEETAIMRGQWGLTQDDYGRRYWSTNGMQLGGGESVPPHYSARSGGLDGFEKLYGLKATRSVSSVRPNLGINRGYREKMLDKQGELTSNTAASGLAVYRGGGGWPDEWIGSILTTEPAGHLTALFKMKVNGFNISASKVMVDGGNLGDHDFTASTDELYRPVNAASGPDGAMYLVDMRIPILQHKKYLTEYLSRHHVEQGMNVKNKNGRIYRIVHKDGALDLAYPRLDGAKPATLVETLSHRNGFWRDQAQRMIVEGQVQAAVPALKKLATADGDELPRIHALWALHGLGAITADAALACLSNGSVELQRTAMQTSEHLLADDADLQAKVIALAKGKNAQIKVQALLSLGSAAQVDDVRSVLLAQAKDKDVRQAAVNSLAEAAGASLAEVAADGDATIAKALGKQVAYRDNALAFHEAVAVAVAHDNVRKSILDGIVEGLQARAGGGKKKNAKVKIRPAKFTVPTVDGFQALINDKAVGTSAKIIAAYTRWDGAAEVKLKPATQQAMARGQGQFVAKACAGCHGPDAKGTDLAPSLIASDLVAGDASVAIRVVLHGLVGKREVAGKTYDAMMPPAAALVNDQELADILTYLRVSRNDDESQAVSADTVKAERAANKSRTAPWTAQELGH